MNSWNLPEQNQVFDGVIAATEDPVLYKQREGVELFDGADVDTRHIRILWYACTARPRVYNRPTTCQERHRIRDAA